MEEILYSAVNSEVGIEVLCENPVNLRSKLYAAMRQAREEGNQDFSEITLHLSPVSPQSALWVLNGKAKTRPSPEATPPSTV